MRRALPIAAASLALAACGVSGTRYKEALDQVAVQAEAARAERERAGALARRVADLEDRLDRSERARRALDASLMAQRARADALAAARARLESELDAALAEAHRAAARLAEAAGDPAQPWRAEACSPLGALLRSAGLCAAAPTPALLSGSAPAPAP